MSRASSDDDAASDGWGRVDASASTRDSWDDDDDAIARDDATTTTTTRGVDAASASSDARADDDATRRRAERASRARRSSAAAARTSDDDEDEIDSEATDDDDDDDDDDAFDWRAVRARDDDGATARKRKSAREDDDADDDADDANPTRLPTRRLAPWRARLPNFAPASELPPQSFHDGELVFVDYEAQFGGPRSAASRAFARRAATADRGGVARDRAATAAAPTATARWFTDARGRKTFVDARGRSLVGKAAYAASQRLRA